MTDMRISGLVFDRGIDSITYAQQDAQPTLPERGESAPQPPCLFGHCQLH